MSKTVEKRPPFADLGANTVDEGSPEKKRLRSAIRPLPLKVSELSAGSAKSSKKSKPAQDVCSLASSGASLPDDEEEGYARIRVGDVLDSRYRAEKYLGYGAYGSVISCEDIFSNGEKVALKVGRAGDEYVAAAVNEVMIMQHLQNGGQGAQIIHFLNHFYFSSSLGTHVSIVYELMDMTLLRHMENQGIIELTQVKSIAKALLSALTFCEERGVVHGDIKPENILLAAQTQKESAVRLVDFGLSFFTDENKGPQPAQEIGTLEYRAPEILLKVKPYSPKVDIWALACTVYEVLTLNYLVKVNDRKPKKSKKYDEIELVISTIITRLGSMPYGLVRRAPREQRAYFSCYHDNAHTTIPKMVNITPSPPPAGSTRICDYLVDEYFFDPLEAQAIATFLQPQLLLDPAQRISAADAAQLSWLFTSHQQQDAHE